MSVVGPSMPPAVRQGPLCWGQHWSWLLDAAPSKRESPAAAVSMVLRLPTGSSLDCVRRAVAAVAARHESLRSVFQIGPDGSPVQRVLPEAAPVVEVVDVTGESLGRGWAASRPMEGLEQALDPGWDVAAEIPVRVVVGMVRGAPELLLLSIHIVAVDGVSMAIVSGELLDVIEGWVAGRAPELPAVRWQPLDQAAFEASERTTQRNRQNLDRWREFYQDSPPTALPFYWENILGFGKGIRAELRSRELGRACERIARRCSASESVVLLAGLVSMLAAWSGHDRAIVGETVACRYLPAMQSSVGRYKAVTRFLVDVPGDLTFDDVVGRTRAASARAHVESICEEGELAMLMSRQSVAQGSRIEYPPQFNYHRYSAGNGRPDSRGWEPVIAHRLPGSGWVTSQADQTASRDGSADSLDDAPAIVASDDDIPLPLPLVDVWPSVDGSLRILLRCSTQLLPGGGRDFLVQWDRLIRHAADRPRMFMSDLLKVVVDLPRFWGGPRWLSHRGSWFSLDDACRLLCEHPEVIAAQVFHDGAGRLSAYVAVDGGHLTAQQLHEHMRDQASTWPTVILPHHYTVCRRAPLDPGDRAQWRVQEVIDAGAGRAAPRRTPCGHREALLLRSLAAVAPQVRADLSASYAELGGDFLRIPALIGELARAGYHGLTHQDLLGMATLARLASKLRPNRTGLGNHDVSHAA